jgi:hypothetical protein
MGPSTHVGVIRGATFVSMLQAWNGGTLALQKPGEAPSGDAPSGDAPSGDAPSSDAEVPELQASGGSTATHASALRIGRIRRGYARLRQTATAPARATTAKPALSAKARLFFLSAEVASDVSWTRPTRDIEIRNRAPRVGARA